MQLFTHSPTLSGMGERMRKKKRNLWIELKTIIQDRKGRENNNSSNKYIIRIYKWCTTQLLTIHQLMSSQFPEATPAWGNPSIIVQYGVIWYGISLWPVQLYWIFTLPAPCSLPSSLAGETVGEAEKTEISLAFYCTTQQQLETSVCYQHCFSPKTKI